MADWQPIETAPKGVRVLIWDGAPYFASWSDECEHGQFNTAPGWQIFECEDGFYSCAADAPTHWAPVPNGPSNPTTEKD